MSLLISFRRPCRSKHRPGLRLRTERIERRASRKKKKGTCARNTSASLEFFLSLQNNSCTRLTVVFIVHDYSMTVIVRTTLQRTTSITTTYFTLTTTYTLHSIITMLLFCISGGTDARYDIILYKQHNNILLSRFLQ